MKFASYILVFLIHALILISSCSTSRESLIDVGTAHAFRAGFPEVKARATGFFDTASSPVLDIHAEIMHRSLIFTSSEGIKTANIQIHGYLRDVQNSAELVLRFSEEFRIQSNTDSIIFDSSSSLVFERRLQASPGLYQLDLLIKDQTSDKTSSLKLFVRIPDPLSSKPDLTDIRITRQIDNQEEVVTSFLIPSEGDSLHFTFFSVIPKDIPFVSLTSKLYKIRSDTEIPRPLSQIPISTASLAFQGIDYSTLTELNSWEHSVDSTYGVIPFSAIAEIKEPGVYRFLVTIKSDNQENDIFGKKRFRDFAIVGGNFPEIKTQQDMIPPLSYLMDRREFLRISSISEPDSLRRAFEQFWLRNTRNRSVARDIIQLYFSRVEEANNYFSGFREGWMTDMGMIYILFGPPIHIENTIDSMTWYYGFDRMDPRNSFRFERARVAGESFPFQHYILVRNRLYLEIENSIIQDWLSGRVLTRGGL